MHNKNIKISIVIPIRNEENYIRECIDSILNFDFSKESMEVIFVDGLSQDNTVEIIKEYQKEYPYIKLITNDKKIVPISMNLGIKEAVGEYICRLDAHAHYPYNYISELLAWSQTLNADNVGTVCITKVKNNTNTAKAIQFVMSDKFGVGNSLFRTGAKEPIEVDTVPFGFYKKDIFEKIGFYNEALVRVQDLELNKRLKKNNGKIYLIPNIQCIYYPRENFKSFSENRFQTGKWIILASYFTNSLQSISLRHMIPLLFCSTVIFSFLLGFFHQSFWIMFVFFVLSYSTILLARAIKITHTVRLSLYILFAYFVLHFSYGFGSFKGLMEVIKKEFITRFQNFSKKH